MKRHLALHGLRCYIKNVSGITIVNMTQGLTLQCVHLTKV